MTGWAELGVAGAGAHPSNALPPKEAHSRTHSSLIQREDLQCPRLQGRSSQQPVFTAAHKGERRETRGVKVALPAKTGWGQGGGSQMSPTHSEQRAQCPGLRSCPQQVHPPNPHLPRPGPGAHSPFCAREDSPSLSFWGDRRRRGTGRGLRALLSLGPIFIMLGCHFGVAGTRLVKWDSPAVLGEKLHL